MTYHGGSHFGGYVFYAWYVLRYAHADFYISLVVGRYMESHVAKALPVS